MPFYFSIEIDAPNGLTGIEEHLSDCKMNLEPWESGFNGKVILKNPIDSGYEWAMDFYKTRLVASGKFYDSISSAKDDLESLSNVLTKGNFAHQILLDDETGYLCKNYHYNWPNSENT